MKLIGIALLAVLSGTAMWYDLFNSFGPWFAACVMAVLLLLGIYQYLRSRRITVTISIRSRIPVVTPVMEVKPDAA